MTATGSVRLGIQERAQGGEVSDAVGSGAGTGPRRRARGMLVYHASEKDCIGEDGDEPQECVICFEEFSVGDEMGRLECLCKFHKVCCFLARAFFSSFSKSFVYESGKNMERLGSSLTARDKR